MVCVTKIAFSSVSVTSELGMWQLEVLNYGIMEVNLFEDGPSSALTLCYSGEFESQHLSTNGSSLWVGLEFFIFIFQKQRKKNCQMSFSCEYLLLLDKLKIDIFVLVDDVFILHFMIKANWWLLIRHKIFERLCNGWLILRSNATIASSLGEVEITVDPSRGHHSDVARHIVL